MTESPKPTDAPDSTKAAAIFEKAKALTDEGGFDEAVDIYLQGIKLAPQDLEAIQALRDCSLRRKAAGGPPLGSLARLWMLRRATDLQRFLNALKLLAYSPGDVDHMRAVLRASYKCGYDEVTEWIAAIIKRAIHEQRRFNWPW